MERSPRPKHYKPLKQPQLTGKEKSAVFQAMMERQSLSEGECQSSDENGEYEGREQDDGTRASRPCRNYGLQSYQLHTELKHEIAEVLEQIRKEAKKNPHAHVQVRNRTLASITKRYLYEREYEKASKCLEDAKKLLQKYRSRQGETV
ncbi:33K [Psittacine adenovirus 3]|uniref:33K n=1 Tax=Psittacine adenovirus 3 TaxID=1580497 RepID=A0A0A7JTJ4_9ADEN|nr:33K [Psittacine adenovirus 3]AIZ35777.1 33K [Psittacine adenovirus 3]